MSIREHILRAIVAALDAGDSPAVAVYRSRVDQICTEGDESVLPCYDVTPGPEKDDSSAGDNEAWGRSLTVTVRALCDATDSPHGDGALDPLYVAAVQALLADVTLGGLAIGIDWTGTDEPVFRPGGRDLLGMAMTFEVTFAVKRGDPTQKG